MPEKAENQKEKILNNHLLRLFELTATYNKNNSRLKQLKNRLTAEPPKPTDKSELKEPMQNTIIQKIELLICTIQNENDSYYELLNQLEEIV